MAKTGRNAPCPCGSGLKFKRCCGDLTKAPVSNRASSTAELQKRVAQMLERQRARELIRTQQQGLGRPIIAKKFGDHQVVAVGNAVHYSKGWKYFPDFLSDYIKDVLGRDWGNAELAKKLEDRHPILQWYDAFCRYQQAGRKEGEGDYSGPLTGIVCCYLGLAYNLYLLKHNVELQAKLIARLKNVEQFQGAYYELIVANCLIRAGFELTLEDEDDRHSRHCEFAAISKQTGARYSVEAKMRGVSGLLGRTDADGGPTEAHATRGLIRNLNKSLGKPSNGERLIFLDVNTDPMPPDAEQGKMPRWMEKAGELLDRRELKLAEGERAYVFVTNLPFHRALDDEARGQSVLGHGLGIPDFAKPGSYTFVELWKQKQKHSDANGIVKAVMSYPQIPNRFDGDLQLPESARPSQVVIGQTYFFPDAGPQGVLGEVTSALMSPETKQVHIGIKCADGKTRVLKRDVTDEEVAAYRAHPEAYFGVIRRHSRNLTTAYELFEWMVEAYKNTPKERLLELAKGHPNFEALQKLDQLDLALELCQAWAAMVEAQSQNKKE